MTVQTVNEGSWVDLLGAISVAVRLGEDGDRLASMMARREWQTFTHPSSIAIHYGPEWVALFPKAMSAFKDACEVLREVLGRGLVAGEGQMFNGAPRRPITGSEWGTRYINFGRSQLEALIGTRSDEFPTVFSVRVNADDVRLEYLKAKGTANSASDRGAAPASAVRPTAPKAIATFLRNKYPAGRPSLSKPILLQVIEKEAPEIGRVSTSSIDRALKFAWAAPQPTSNRVK